MLTLFSYPGLYGLEDNNPYGLKVFAFLRLCRVPFVHEHILDAHAAPRAQLPYIVDGDRTVGDSDAIVAHLEQTYALTIDDALTEPEEDLDLLVRPLARRPLLGHVVLALERSALLADLPRRAPRRPSGHHARRARGRPEVQLRALPATRASDGFPPDDVYARGIADLHAIANLPRGDRVRLRPHAPRAPTSLDARDLWLRRQHLLLRDRHAAQAVRGVTSAARSPLPGDAGSVRADRVRRAGLKARPTRRRTECLAARGAVRCA